MGIKCLIPAGGFGKRLGDITLNKPKALLNLGSNRKVLDLIYDNICEIPGLDEVCIITNEVFLKDFKIWAQSTNQKKPITVISDGGESEETKKGANSGTLSALRAKGWEKEDILLIGSDLFIPVPLKNFSEKFLEKDLSLVVACDYKDKERASKLIVIEEIDNNGIVKKAREKPKDPKTTWGVPLIYFIKGKDLGYFEEAIGSKKDNIGYFFEILYNKSKVRTIFSKKIILDIGTKEEYEYIMGLF